jgi:hypothetical protein
MYVTLRLISVFKRIRHWTPPQVGSFYLYQDYFNIILPSTLGCPKSLLLSSSSIKFCTYQLCHVCYTSVRRSLRVKMYKYACNRSWTPIGLLDIEAPKFPGRLHTEVRLSALRAGRPLPPGRFIVLISLRCWIYPRSIARLERLGKLKHPVTSTRIEPPSLVISGAEKQLWIHHTHTSHPLYCYTAHPSDRWLVDFRVSQIFNTPHKIMHNWVTSLHACEIL